MSRILAVDYGQRRIGIAVSDPTRTIASPLTTLTRRAGKRPPWAELMRIVEDQAVGQIVVGLPLGLSGEEGDWAREVREFGAQLSRRTGLAIEWIDERLSSVGAERAVRGMGLKRSQREERERIDAAAASIILQMYLARERNRGPNDAESE